MFARVRRSSAPVSSRPNGRYLPCVCRSHIQRSPCCCTANFHQQKPSWLKSLQRNSFLFPQHLYSPAGTIVHSIEIVENKLSTMKTTSTRRAALFVVAAVAAIAFSADYVSASNGRVVVGASSRRMLRRATSNKRQLSWSWTSLLRKSSGSCCFARERSSFAQLPSLKCSTAYGSAHSHHSRS